MYRAICYNVREPSHPVSRYSARGPTDTRALGHPAQLHKAKEPADASTRRRFPGRRTTGRSVTAAAAAAAAPAAAASSSLRNRQHHCGRPERRTCSPKHPRRPRPAGLPSRRPGRSRILGSRRTRRRLHRTLGCWVGFAGSRRDWIETAATMIRYVTELIGEALGARFCGTQRAAGVKRAG